jgi:peptidoglycan/LPS O-acetylase OafA/YrhL
VHASLREGEVANPGPKTRFAALDACRGFCAVAVMLYHLDAQTHFYASPFVRHGYLAVDFFFVLSGFVIASAYGRKLSSPREFGRFALRRFGRLYPLHAFVLLLYVLVQGALLLASQAAFTDNYSLPSLLANVALVQGFGRYHETWNYPAWSISVELWSNLAFGLYVLWLGRRSAWLSVVLFIATGAYAAFGHQIQLPVSDDANAALLDVAQSVFAYLLGTFLYAAYARLKRSAWRPAAFLQGSAEGVALILVAVVFDLGDQIPEVLIPVFFGVVVLVFAFEAGPVSALLRRPLCVGLGTISYSVYLTHSVYLMGLESALMALGHVLGMTASVSVGGDDVLVLGGPWAMDLAAILCVATALAGSALTYRFIEEPARRFFNALSNGRSFRAARSTAQTPVDLPVPATTTTT